MYSQEALGVAMSVEQVEFNPLTLELKIKNLHLPDDGGKTLLNVGKLYLNIDINTLFNKVLLVRTLSISNVEFNIQKTNSQTNLYPLIARFHSGQSATTNQVVHEDQSQPWHLLVQDFVLNNSTLRFDDLSLLEPVRSRIDITSLVSNRITTKPNQSFPYQLSAHINRI